MACKDHPRIFLSVKDMHVVYRFTHIGIITEFVSDDMFVLLDIVERIYGLPNLKRMAKKRMVN